MPDVIKLHDLAGNFLCEAKLSPKKNRSLLPLIAWFDEGSKRRYFLQHPLAVENYHEVDCVEDMLPVEPQPCQTP